MKKIATLIIAIICATAVMAQEVENSPMKRHEITGGIGLLSHTQIVTFLVDMVGTIVTGGLLMQMDSYNVLTPNLSYRYWFTDRYALGVGFAFDANSVRVRRQGETAENMTRYRRNFYTFALENTFSYTRSSNFQLYGQLGLGATFISIPGNDYGIGRVPLFNMQITPLGMRIGRDYAGFMEFGYGYKGFINAGFSARF